MISVLSKDHASALAQRASDVGCGLARLGMVDEAAFVLVLAQVAVLLAADKEELQKPGDAK